MLFRSGGGVAAVTSTVLLVRHAAAASRRDWTGDDGDRPLTERGEQQAVGLIGQLADHPVARVLSSPARRCVDTVVPLAAVRGRTIERVQALAEGTADAALDLLLEMEGGVVACTHGDVIGAMLDELQQRGWDFPPELRYAKGSTWVLAAAARRATYLPPPSLPST